jgi:hypothetical protein
VIILGAVAALAVATLTVNAENRSTGTKAGSLISLVAARTHVVPADRDDVAIAVRATAAAVTSKPVENVAAVPRLAAPKVAVSAACQVAINNLKAMHQADVAEDTAERNSVPSAAALAAERAEDAAEAQQWTTALLAARNACGPQRTAACQAAISNLQAALQSWRNEDLRDLRIRMVADWSTKLAAVRSAFAGVAAACPVRA